MASRSPSDLAIDAVTRAYNEASRNPDSELASAVHQVRRWPSLADWSRGFLDRPLFASQPELLRATDDVRQLAGLLASLPERLFDGDLGRFCVAAGIDPVRARLLTYCGGAAPPFYGRADLYHDGTSFRLLELGLGSPAGCWDHAGELCRAFLAVPEVAAFAAEHGLGFTDPARAVVDTLRKMTPSSAAGEDPVVVLVEGPSGLGTWRAIWGPFAARLAELGLHLHLAEVGDLREHAGRLTLHGRPVDVVYRCFSVDQILDDPTGLELVEPILRAHLEGRVLLWTPWESNLYSSKGCLALLHDQAHQASFDERERQLITRIVPWTRMLGAGAAADTRDLVAECRDRREQLILKPTAGYGGQGVTAGWETTDRTWTGLLTEAAAGGGCVVQERVVPSTEPVLDAETGRWQSWEAVWGIFYTPDGYAGTLVRTLPSGHGAVIGISANPQTRTAAMLHHTP